MTDTAFIDERVHLFNHNRIDAIFRQRNAVGFLSAVCFFQLHRIVGCIDGHGFTRYEDFDFFVLSFIDEHKNDLSVGCFKGAERGFKIFRFVVMSLKIE